jgi:two-component system LytT family response regulator
MLRAFLVDDEKNSREVLKALIAEFCPAVTIAGEAESVEKAYEQILTCKPDLVFLDVQMPTGNGFELLKKFSPAPFDVIFVTSYDQYAINALRFSALDYLLKPVDIQQLKDAVQRAEQNSGRREQRHLQVTNLLQSVDPTVTEKKIAFHVNDTVRLVSTKDILYIEGDVNYSTVYTREGDKFTSSKTLKEFEEYLTGFDHFIRIHKSVILNSFHIHHYSKGSPFIIQMVNGVSFEASRRKKGEVLERLKQ